MIAVAPLLWIYHLHIWGYNKNIGTFMESKENLRGYLRVFYPSLLVCHVGIYEIDGPDGYPCLGFKGTLIEHLSCIWSSILL